MGGPPPTPITIPARVPPERGLVHAQHLFEYDRSIDMLFGRGSDADGDVLVVSGSPIGVGDPVDPSIPPVVQIYRRSASGQYLLEQTLSPPTDGPDEERSPWWGWPVTVQGDVIAVGDWQADAPGGSLGLVDVFRFSGGTWTHSQTLSNATDGLEFGFCILFRHGILVIANEGEGGTFQGAVEVWEEEVPGTFSRTHEILGPSGVSWFGQSIHIASATHFFTASSRVEDDSSSVYEVVKSGGSWSIVSSFDAEDDDWSFGGYTQNGMWYDAARDILLVGCYEHVHAGSDAFGGIHVLIRDGDTWEDDDILRLPEDLRWDFNYFGTSLAVTEEGFLVVGSTLGVHVFRPGGTSFVYNSRLSRGDTTYNTLLPPWDGMIDLGATSLCALPGGGVGYGIGWFWWEQRPAFCIARMEVLRNVAELTAPGSYWLGWQQGMDADVNGLLVASNEGGDESVRTWKRLGSEYVYEGRLPEPVGYEWSKYQVRISGNTLVVGSYQWNSNAGAVLVFIRNENDDGWELQQAIQNTVPGRYIFGYSVAVHGNTLAALATAGGITDDCEVRIYIRSGTTWTLQQTIPLHFVDTADPVVPIALEGNVLAVGIPHYEYLAPSREGQVHIFRRTGAVWSESQVIDAVDHCGFGANQLFGRSVALDGGVLVVGASGYTGESYVAPAVLVFEQDGGQFEEVARFSSVRRYEDDRAEHLGFSVAKRGDVIVAGDTGMPFLFYSPTWWGIPRVQVGAALLIGKEDGDWVLRHYLRPSELNLNPDDFEGGGGDTIWGNAVATDGWSAFYASPNRYAGNGSIHHFEPEWEPPGPWPGCYCSAYGQSMYGPCSPYGNCLEVGGIGPIVTKIETPDLKTLIVTFEREMANNADLVNPRAYVLTGGARVVSVVRLNATQVRLRTSRKLRNRRAYQLTVRANPGS